MIIIKMLTDIMLIKKLTKKRFISLFMPRYLELRIFLKITPINIKLKEHIKNKIQLINKLFILVKIHIE